MPPPKVVNQRFTEDYQFIRMPNKTTEITLWLFGKPEWEIDLEKAKPDDIAALGKDIKDRLERVSKIFEKLEKNDWDRSAGLYDIMMFKNVTKKEAIKELKRLEINPKDVSIHEWDEEDSE